ncbi:MAG: response regulator [Ignavibacteriales bacterium]|nr:response regulator [Ignavibacteriales bacterium]
MRHYLRQTEEKIPATYLEFPALAKDGRVIWLGQNVQVILEGAKIVEVQAVARDITDLKKAEEERLRLEQQFRQAQKMESIGRLAGGIAHDFNNILGIILAYTSILEGGKNSPSNNQMSLLAIKNTVGRAKKMVKELMTLAHKTRPELVFVDINSSVQDFTNMIMETFPRTIAFLLDLDPRVAGILADPNQFDQVLLNLYVNARDAMPRGGTLTVRTTKIQGETLRDRFPEAETNDYVCLSVSDTGIGMDDKIRARVFEPFFSTKKQSSGSGLGLAVVYGIVQSHKGFIEVVSEVDEGSSFRLFFPASRPDQERLMEMRYLGERTLAGHETILFVEDEDLLRSAVGGVLQQKGYRVLFAKDGIEAVEIFMKNHHDIKLVLSDLGLPGLGGWEACVTMREINPGVRIIVASGFVEPQMKAEMAKLGDNHFIYKPYETSEVLERIREVLDAPSS